MPVRHPFRVVALFVLTLALGVPTTASAHGPTECTAGPARLASATAPHIVDAHADGVAPWGTPYGPAADLIGSWVTGPSKWEDRASGEKFVAHLRVEDFDRPPAFARYYFVFTGADGDRWVRAVFDVATNAWSFAYGVMNGTTYAQQGNTTGSVNTNADTISIEIPKETIPTRPADGKALDLGVIAARSFFRHEPIPGGAVGNLRQIDEAAGDCAVTLYEAAPAI